MGAVQIEHGVVLEGEGGGQGVLPLANYFGINWKYYIYHIFLYTPLENILLRRPCSVCRMKEKTREEKW